MARRRVSLAVALGDAAAPELCARGEHVQAESGRLPKF
jgi:hypothetical protein